MSTTIAFGKKAFTTAVVGATILWSVGFSALAPLSASAANAGDLIKGSLPAVYYYGSDGKRYVFPNEKTYKTWYSDFSSVKTITDAELAAIAIGGNVTYKATTTSMRAVKITTSPTVYVVTNGGELRAIPNEATAVTLLGASWNTKVDDVPDAFFTNYKVGAAVAANAALSSLAAASTNISADKSLAAAPATPATGALTLSAGDMPPSASAPYSAGDIIFGRVKFDGTGDVTKVKVTRSGLSADLDLSAVKLFDGTTQLGTNQTFDASHQAGFVLTTPWKVSGSKVLTIAANIASAAAGATAGNTVILGIHAASDVTLSSGSVGGTFPLKGNPMTVSAATIGSVTLAQGSGNPTADTTTDAGNTTRVKLHETRLTMGSVEDGEITSITYLKGGTHIGTDLKALTLRDETNAKTLATLSGWNADSRAVFDLSASPIKVTKGNSVNLSLNVEAGDVVAGSGRTLGARFENANGVSVRGTTYNLGLVPSYTGGWDGTATAQTINAGSVTVVKSSATPATGNIAPGATAELARWDFIVKGEDARSTSTTVALTLGTMLRTEVTGCVLKDKNNTVVAGPVDANATPAVVFTTTLTFPVGTNAYSFHCNIASAVSAADTILAGMTPSTGTTLTGVGTSNTITATPATAVNGNTLTVQAGALTAVNRATPIAANVVPGAQLVALAELGLDTSSSGENVRMTQVIFTDVVGGAGANIADWANLRLTKDDGATLVSDIKQPTGTDGANGTVTFALTSPLEVTKKTSTLLKLWGDLKAGVTAGETHVFRVNAAANLTATGVTTGAAVTPTMSPTAGTGGQTMTVSAAGTLTTSLDASSPVAGVVVAGKTGVTATVLKMVGANETLRLESVKLTLEGSAKSADVAKVYLYDGDTKVGEGFLTASAAPTVTFDLSGKNYDVKNLETKRLTAKVDLNNTLAGSTSGNTVALSLAATGDLVAKGLSSGSTVNASATVTGTSLSIRKTIPTFTRNVGNSSALVPGSFDFLVDVTADPAADVKFDKGTTGGTYAAGEGMLRFTITESGTGGAAKTANLIRKSNNTTLSSLTGLDLDTVGALVFNFEDVALTVAAGTTETLIARVDLSGYVTTGNTFQLSLPSDASATLAATNSVRYNDDATGDASDLNGFGLLSLPVTFTAVKS